MTLCRLAIPAYQSYSMVKQEKKIFMRPEKKHLIVMLALILGVFTVCAEEKTPADPLRDEAAGGNPESCFHLGNEYFYGEKRKQNLT